MVCTLLLHEDVQNKMHNMKTAKFIHLLDENLVIKLRMCCIQIYNRMSGDSLARQMNKKSVRALLVARSAFRGSGNARYGRTSNAEASRRICYKSFISTPVLTNDELHIHMASTIASFLTISSNLPDS